MEINVKYIFVALVACIAASTVKAQDLDRCADILLEGSYYPDCSTVNEYFRCIIKELGLHKGEYGDTIAKLKEHLKDALIFLGLSCYIDFDDLVEQIRREEGYYQYVPTTTTKRPNDYDACRYYKPCDQICTNTGPDSYSCSCSPGYRPDKKYPNQCVDIDECKESQYRCEGKCVNTEGSFRCECLQGYTLGSDGSSCEQVSTGYHGCVDNRPYGCLGIPDGDYAVCGPECQRGVYISCSNFQVHFRWCATGWYQYPKGHRFEAKLVFDPYLRRCERSTRSCPRMLDRYLESA